MRVLVPIALSSCLNAFSDALRQHARKVRRRRFALRLDPV